MGRVKNMKIQRSASETLLDFCAAWFAQRDAVGTLAFFTEDVDGLRYHELCLYFLMDISDTHLTQRGPVFTLTEGTHTHTFEWLAFDRLKDAYFYPIFLKKEIYNLPNALTVRAEFE